MPIRNDAHRDEFHRDQQWHKPCRVATTANVTISTALNSGDTLDGITLADGDRVLVKNQSTGAQNGIYVVSATPERAYDMLAGVQALGAFVHVTAGTANGGKLFKNTNTTLPTIDTTALTFTEFTGSGISGITVEDEGTPLSTLATTLDFAGAGVTATGSGTEKTITIPGGIAGITVQDEGSPLSTLATTLDFVGAGVVATGSGATKTVTISGGGGGGGSVDVQVFTSIGNTTWTKPTCTMVRVICVGGGGGGGSGRKATAGTIAAGGTGGAGGGMSIKDFLASDLGSTEKLTVGAGGTGGTAISANSTSGNPGNNGNPSFFGNSVDGTPGDALVVGGGGPNGAGGGTSTGVGNYAGTGNVQSLTSTSSGHLSETFADTPSNQDWLTAGGRSIISGTARPGSTQYACGGGGGGGVRNSGTERSGGAGGVPAHRAGQTPAAGGGVHAAGSNGTSISGSDTLAPGGFGGGGGGGSNTAAAIGNGGDGGLYGGGGGGGGGGTDSVVNSGAGGNGADGIVVVISW